MKIFTAEQMREFDRVAVEEYKIPSIVLMENAALRVVEFLEMKFAPLKGKRIVVLCGKGNNGGDGFAIARHLMNAGCEINVVAAAPLDEMQGDAHLSRQMFAATLDPERHVWSPPEENTIELTGKGSIYDAVRTNPLFLSYDILIDALLGTGFQGDVRDARIAQGLQLIEEQPEIERSHLLHGSKKRIRVAVDLPSGLNADTGEAAYNVRGIVAGGPDQQYRDAEVSRSKDGYAKLTSFNRTRADYTVTFATPKRGMFVRDGLKACGEIWVGDIGTRDEHLEMARTACSCFTHEHARSSLYYHLRPVDAHKGDAGRAIVIGGSFGMSGAPTLAARAVLKTGAGLCIACLPEKILSTFAIGCPEATSKPLPCDKDGRLIAEAADLLPDIWKGAQVVAIGPGISRGQSTLEFVRRVVRECPLPLVIDADALYALREIADEVKAREAPTILTPHPGEMGELMQIETSAVNDDRFETAIGCAKHYNAIVVLKGARSIVALPNGDTCVNLTGNPGMATGGSGDVLTGTLAGLLAQTRNAQTATLLGVYLHGLAGDLCFETKGNGLIAGDIADAIPQALLEIAKPLEASPNARLRKLQ